MITVTEKGESIEIDPRMIHSVSFSPVWHGTLIIEKDGTRHLVDETVDQVNAQRKLLKED